MMPRPRFPMQGGMGPRMMMGPGSNQFGAGGSMMNLFGGRNTMMGQGSGMMGMGNPLMGGAQPGRGAGGLLSRLLGRGGNPLGAAGGPAGLQGAGRAVSGGGGLLQSLSNPGGLNNILTNTQQILRTAQSIGPMVQQYGPLVRNLPAMWKLYRGLKNAPDATNDENQTEEKNKTEVAIESSENGTNHHDTKDGSSARKRKAPGKTTSSTEVQEGASVPKLYV